MAEIEEMSYHMMFYTSETRGKCRRKKIKKKLSERDFILLV